jgi:surface antigen
MLLAATAVALVFGAMPASAQSGPGPGPDPYGYYSQYDHDGYYDRDGHYIRYGDRHDSGYDNPPPPPAYREGAYEDNCRRGNSAAGTIFGALAGGLIGSAASHGHGGAVVGGAILGGMLGNAVSRDMPCEDHQYAFRVYAQGLDGEIGHRYDWRHGDDYGYFVPEREFQRDGYVCRAFTETTYVHGQAFTRSGTACRQRDGYWHFDE